MSLGFLARSGAAMLAAALALAVLVYGMSGWFGGDPIVEQGPVRATRRGGVAAVVLSGDMGLGWGMGGKIAARLADDGLPVVAVNSLAYYRTARSPGETKALVADVIARAVRRTPAGRVVLIGQSFGADMLHVGLAGLPVPLRRRVQAVILIVPETSVIFHASPAEMFELDPPDAAALPTARRLDWVPVTCIRGAEERHSLCPLLRLPNVARVTLPGGHRLQFDVARLYATIRHAIAVSAGDRGNITNSTFPVHGDASRSSAQRRA